MNLDDEKKNYRNLAIELFAIQEKLDQGTYEEAFDNLARHFVHTLPQLKLYRYRSSFNWRYSLPIIERNTVYLCPLEKQNDPFEFAFNDDFGEIVKRVPILREGRNFNILSSASHFQNALKNLCKELNLYKKKISVACFSEEKDNILLWAHYANNHKGICIEYSALDLLQLFQCFLLPVIYQKDLPTLSSIMEINSLSSYKIAFERISTKSDIWNYEKEWRVIKYFENETDDHYVEFPKPTAIYLGANASSISWNRVLKTCATKKIPLYVMVPDKYSFSLTDKLIYDPHKNREII